MAYPPFEQMRSAVEQAGFEVSVKPCYAAYSGGSSAGMRYNVTTRYFAPEAGEWHEANLVMDDLDGFYHEFLQHFKERVKDRNEDSDYKNHLNAVMKNMALLMGYY